MRNCFFWSVLFLVSFIFCAGAFAEAEFSLYEPYLNDNAPKILEIVEKTVIGDIEVTRMKFLSRVMPTGPKAGQKSIIYGILARPTAPGPHPGVLVVHGGGGYADQVRGQVESWAKKGYVSFCQDQPGFTNQSKSGSSVPYWSATTFGVEGDINTCGLLDGVLAALNGLRMLRSQPDVDTSRVGITGGSWGGYMTSMISGISGDRLDASFAVYGCGYFDIGGHWANTIESMSDVNREAWLKWLDAGRRAYNIKSKFFLTSPTNDWYFWPNMMMRMFGEIPGEKRFCISANDCHRLSFPGGTGGPISHSPHRTYMELAWMSHNLKNELAAFGNCTPVSTVRDGNDIEVRFSFNGPDPVVGYSIYYCYGETPFRTNYWIRLDTVNEGNNFFSAKVPVYEVDQPLWWYGLITDSKQVSVSTLYNKVEPQNVGFAASDRRAEDFTEDFEDNDFWGRWRKSYASKDTGVLSITGSAAHSGSYGLLIQNQISPQYYGLRGVDLRREGSGLKLYAKIVEGNSFDVELVTEAWNNIRFFWIKHVTIPSGSWKEIEIPWEEFEFSKVSNIYHATPITWNGPMLSGMLGPDLGMLRISTVQGDKIYVDDISLMDRDVSKAWNPYPTYDAKWMSRNVVLSWAPGQGAVSHEVYVGSSSYVVGVADVSSSAYAGSTDSNSWDVNGLSLDRSYFWRVDEFDGTNRVKGEVWQFRTTESKAGRPTPSNGATNVSRDVILQWQAGVSAESHKVYIGTDSAAVTNRSVTEHVVNDSRWQLPAELDPGVTYYWCVDENCGGETAAGEVWRFTIEDGTAYECEPYNKGTEVENHPFLRWKSPAWCTSYDVYFGRDSTAVSAATVSSDEYRGNFSVRTLEIEDFLDGHNLYYWRVDCHGAGVLWQGPLWRFETGDARQEAAYDSALEGHWRFDDANGLQAYDCTGRGNVGFISGEADWGDGKLKGGLSFDGVDDIVEIPDFNYCGEANSLAVNFWFRAGGLSGTGEQCLFSHGNNAEDGLWVSIGEDASGYAGKVKTILRTGNGHEFSIVSDELVNDGVWHAYSLSLSDAAGGEVYLDGELCGRDANSGGGLDAEGSIFAGGKDGSCYFGDSGSMGFIDDLRIYSRAIGQYEIAGICQDDPDARQAGMAFPVNQWTGERTSMVLQWQGGEGAEFYDVYFADDANLILNAMPGSEFYKGRFDVNSYHVYDLNQGQSYYWAIDCAGAGRVRAGAIWNFETGQRASGSSTAAASNSLSWYHNIDPGLERMLVAGVVCEDTELADMNVVEVSYNGVAMTAVEQSEETIFLGTYLRSQLFYLCADGLPCSGEYEMKVRLSGIADGISAGVVNLAGMVQQQPEAVMTNSRTNGARGLYTNITTVTDTALVLDVMGCGNSGAFSVATINMEERYNTYGSQCSAAGGIGGGYASDYIRMSWKNENPAHMSHSVAAFAVAESREYDLSCGGYILKSQQIYGKNDFAQSYRVKIRNNGPEAVEKVCLRMTSSENGVRFMNDEVVFHSIGSGQIVVSDDVFVVSVDKPSLLDISKLSMTVVDGQEGDLTGDGEINYSDVLSFCEQWLMRSGNMREDMYRNENVNFSDWAIMAEKWQSKP